MENERKILALLGHPEEGQRFVHVGLAISEEIIKLHGGKMVIKSKKNEGTEISFSINNDSRKSGTQ